MVPWNTKANETDRRFVPVDRVVGSDLSPKLIRDLLKLNPIGDVQQFLTPSVSRDAGTSRLCRWWSITVSSTRPDATAATHMWRARARAALASPPTTGSDYILEAGGGGPTP